MTKIKPKEWDLLMAPEVPKQQIRATVAQQARLALAELDLDQSYNTNQLVEALYPRAIADQSLRGDEARHEIYRLLAVLARNGMEDCCVKGEVTGKYMGRDKRPWLWFCPPEQKCCPTCGQPLPLKVEA